MRRWLVAGVLGALISFVSSEATACPLCLSRALFITSQELGYSERAVLVDPTSDGTQFRVVAVIKGEAPANGVIADRVFRADPVANTGTKPLLLLRHDLWRWWVNLAPSTRDTPTGCGSWPPPGQPPT